VTSSGRGLGGIAPLSFSVAKEVAAAPSHSAGDSRECRYLARRLGRRVAISVEDPRHHLHVVGETGTGKSTLIAQMVLPTPPPAAPPWSSTPRATSSRRFLPAYQRAIDKMCLLDPDDQRRAVGLNVLYSRGASCAGQHSCSQRPVGTILNLCDASCCIARCAWRLSPLRPSAANSEASNWEGSVAYRTCAGVLVVRRQGLEPRTVALRGHTAGLGTSAIARGMAADLGKRCP
jgi:hypothetical protein